MEIYKTNTGTGAIKVGEWKADVDEWFDVVYCTSCGFKVLRDLRPKDCPACNSRNEEKHDVI